MNRPATIDLATLTLRQWLALRRNLFRPAELARMTGIPKPRASEILRGQPIYPAATAKVRTFLGDEVDDELFAALMTNTAAVEAARPA